MHIPRWPRLLAALAAAAFLLTVSTVLPAAASAQLDALYSQVLKHPADSKLNLNFARAAEAAGVLRWALSAYERVAVNDPGNAEAQAGLQRIRRKLQPDFSQVTVELGSAVETNPRYYLGPRRTETEGLASVSLRDERAVNGQRWRTTGAVAGQFYSQSDDLGYGYAGGNIGPVIDLFSGVSLVPAIGGAATFYDQHFYYGEAAVSATFEGTSEGVYQSLQFKLAHRSYGDFFPSGDGYYTEARGRIAFLNAIANSGVLIVSPWLLYSDSPGTAISPVLTELAPGAYVEGGVKIEAYREITDWLTVGANVAYSRRAYRDDLTPGGDKRADDLLVPGATLLFPHVFSYQTDIRFDYKYLWNKSNDPTKSFTDHLVTAALIFRFDPRQPYWAQTPMLPAAR